MSLRDTTTIVSLDNINSQVETWLRTLGLIKNSENVASLDIEFSKIDKNPQTGELVVPVRVKSYKEMEVRVIKHG